MNKSYSPIHLLRFLKTVKTKIDGHFILKIENKFMVFTSKPINGLVCHKVSETNIKGQPKAQYIAENVHTYDPSLHKLTQTNDCNVFYSSNNKELLSYEQKLKLISELTQHD
ncbi:hypothetical protein EON71_00140 [bacterium]|nr:MAG: hypothetical protein EON71_00140 [bacterium]